MFPHKDIHTKTLMSPDYKYSNQIYHYIMVNERFAYNITNVRTYSESECVLDHLLVLSNLRDKLKSQND